MKHLIKVDVTLLIRHYSNNLLNTQILQMYKTIANSDKPP